MTPDRPRSRTFDLVMVALCAMLVVGGYLLVWADDPSRGLLSGNQLFSIWALPVYLGFLPAAYLLLLWWAGRGRAGARGIPDGYRAATIGAAIFLLALVAEFAWRSVGGRPASGPEGVLTPSRIALSVGAALLISGPLLSLAGRLRAGAPPGRATGSAASINGVAFAVAVGLLMALTSLVTGFVHPFVVLAGAPIEVSTQETPTDLYLVPVDGSGSRRLTTTPNEWEAHPDVAPDGSQIAFARGGLEDFRVYTAEADGTDATRFTGRDSHEDGPIWSHDGNQLAIWAALAEVAPTPTPTGPAPAPGPSLKPPQLDLSGLSIWIYAFDGSGGQPLLAQGGAGAEAWSPDDTRVCGWTVAAGTFDIAIWDAATGTTTPVITTPDSQEWGCTWSPDGSRIAYHSDTDGDWELYSALPDGTDIRQLTDDAGIDQWPRWSPDGTQLAFMSSRGGELDIWLANADGSSPRDLTNDPALEDGFYGLAWVPDGSGLVAASAGRAYATPAPSETVPLGVAAITLNALIVIGVLLLALRLVGPIVGVGTIAGLVGGLLAAFIGREPLLFVSVLAGGITADIVISWYATASRRRLGVAMAGMASAAMVLVYFLTLQFTRGIGWTFDLVIGTVLLSAFLCAGLALLVTWPEQVESVSEATVEQA